MLYLDCLFDLLLFRETLLFLVVINITHDVLVVKEETFYLIGSYAMQFILYTFGLIFFFNSCQVLDIVWLHLKGENNQSTLLH